MKINKVNGYHGYTKNGKTTYVHREVWKEHHGDIPKGMQVHHINNNKDDNRIENLSLVTPAENMQKSDRWGKGYKVKKGYKRPYHASRKVNNKDTYMGYFGTACGAYMASMMYFITN